MKRFFLISSIIAFSAFSSSAGEIADSATIHFRQGKSIIDTAFNDNGRNLNRLIDRLKSRPKNVALSLRTIKVSGGASPEGPVSLNNSLSHRRAQAIYEYLSQQIALPDSMVTFSFIGRDWAGLRRIVETDPDVPDRNEALRLIDIIAETATPETEGDAEAIRKLSQIDNGTTYRYLYSKLYPSLRESQILFEYDFTPDIIIPPLQVDAVPPVPEILSVSLPATKPQGRNFYMALKTNMLYDILALPSIGAEFYLGKNLSIVGNWMYGWWDKDNVHRYWRAYGGDLALRWWFGKAAHEKPLIGHHLGLYGGVVTYDFEFGGRGVMGGLPGRPLWDRCNRYAGIEYGYSLPIARRLNIDFTLGVGFMSGKYIKYVPHGNKYLWQSTNHLTWFGPTKAEISLVWLIGNGNYNTKKGGSR